MRDQKREMAIRYQYTSWTFCILRTTIISPKKNKNKKEERESEVEKTMKYTHPHIYIYIYGAKLSNYHNIFLFHFFKKNKRAAGGRGIRFLLCQSIL
jgi:hypothetical protein